MKTAHQSLWLLIPTLIVCAFSFATPAYAYGDNQDITSQVSVTSAGVVTLSSDLLSQSIFTILGWTENFGTNCFLKTTGFSTPFSVSGCGAANTTYWFYVSTTNTGVYPSGNLGYFNISVDAQGRFFTGTGINWNNITVVPPIPFNNIQYVATSTSFFSGTSSSSTLEAISSECASTGNIFAAALCRAFAYLWVPNPAVTNQYIGLASTTASKFPFSYIGGVIGLFGALDASSTKNMISPTIDFPSVDAASSTAFGPILPSVTFLSTSTIQHFMPAGFWDFIYLLMEAAIWLGLTFKLVHEGMKMINVHHE